MTTTFQMAAGRGFSKLHAACSSYCPAFESWLRHVADLVPGSPTLCQFLWEPVAFVSTSYNNTTDNSSIIHDKLNKSQSKLCSIYEDDTGEEDDEDEDS
eukprot:CAMPEP_0197838318 /NCGR_PEP_ID=MMETSP1437-20131217/35726_1 /TAXON_ID=49252 ORGANISM="Eucampia antarctica, Strain CCMP1452" /NCGR_SAMPLE_ID=MMETSP1437 /ASSEMBLY_ACC=CAM_ASM_001096 /LENGTH=98 /DNA_ID=CAMNT_0043446141 /DNA_START=50 /DNA_END=346 /DNA_ORIENTATION=+